MTSAEALMNNILLVILIGYGLIIAALGGLYIHRHHWRERSIPYLYLSIVSVITSTIYTLILCGGIPLPSMISATFIRICVILLFTSCLIFAIVDL